MFDHLQNAKTEGEPFYRVNHVNDYLCRQKGRSKLKGEKAQEWMVSEWKIGFAVEITSV